MRGCEGVLRWEGSLGWEGVRGDGLSFHRMSLRRVIVVLRTARAVLCPLVRCTSGLVLINL